MAKLTDGNSGSIAKVEVPEAGQRFIHDDHRDAPRGFALRVTSAGGKAFVLNYKFDGKQRRKTIGEWPVWSLEAARAEAMELSRGINKGADPLEERRRRKLEPRVRDLAAEWLDMHATGLKSERAIRGLIGGDLVKAIGDIKVSDVRRRDVIEAVEAKAATAPRQAAVMLTYAKRLFDYATDRDILLANPLAGLKPSAIMVQGKKDALKQKARGRVLDTDEIRAFWKNAELCGIHRLTALCLKLILLTGQRPGEVAGMHEREINGRVWTIPASRRGKTETEQSVHLTATALNLIEEARLEVERLTPRRRVQPSGYIFEATPGKSITITGLGRAVDRSALALGAKDTEQWGKWTPHDLRRSMRTGLSVCKVRPDIAELTIGHKKKGILAVYDQHAFDDEKRAAMEAWEAHLLLISGEGDPHARTQRNVFRLEARG